MARSGVTDMRGVEATPRTGVKALTGVVARGVIGRACTASSCCTLEGVGVSDLLGVVAVTELRGVVSDPPGGGVTERSTAVVLDGVSELRGVAAALRGVAEPLAGGPATAERGRSKNSILSRRRGVTILGGVSAAPGGGGVSARRGVRVGPGVAARRGEEVAA